MPLSSQVLRVAGILASHRVKIAAPEPSQLCLPRFTQHKVINVVDQDDILRNGKGAQDPYRLGLGRCYAPEIRPCRKIPGLLS